MTEFLAEALEKELDYGVKELVIILPWLIISLLIKFALSLLKPWVKNSFPCPLSLQGIFFQEKSLFSSFLKISTLDVKVDKSRVASCFFELPHFPQAFRSDVDQLQVLFCMFL